MRFVRYLFSGLLIALALSIACDLFQIYLYDFEDFWQTSFYVKEEIDTEHMKEQIFESAKEYGLEVIYIDKCIEGDYHTQIDIYCSKATEKMFAKDYQLTEGHYGSLFSGWADVSFHSIDELPREQMQKEPEGYFILGQTENAAAYKAGLVDLYGGSLPRPKERDSIQESVKRLVWIWLSVGIVIWLLTYYKTVRLRKEILIRLSLGESISRIVIFHFVKDTLWYSICFLFALLFLYRTYHCLFLINYATGALIVIIAGNFFIYAMLLRYDLKLGFSGVQMSWKLLDVSYILKTVLTFALAVSAASTLALWIKYTDMEQQKEFYEARKEYFYLYLANGSGAIDTWFYRNYFSRFDIQFTCGNGVYDLKDQDKLAICMNANMKDYLCGQLSSVANEISQCEACVLIPEKATLSNDSLDILINTSASFANLEREDVKLIPYNDHAYIINYDVYKGYARTYCPVIIYNNCIEDTRTIEEGRILMELNFGKAMMKLDMAELEDFCTKHELKYVTENVWLNFEHELCNLKRGAFMNMMFLIIQCIVELSLSAAIIRLEFETNRLEIVLKKILGYSIIERIRKQLVLTILSGTIGIIAAVIFYVIFDLSYIFLMCSIILVLMLLETALMIKRFLFMENESIQKTLKGGFL